MFFGKGDPDCIDCTIVNGEWTCTMNCGPRLMPHGKPPESVWLIYPHDGGPPVLWTEPCPFPVDDGDVIQYDLRKRKKPAPE